ncbi:MAG: TIR domain-containing protein [Leptolyngbyaceae cyanobacterium MO_188.B28]|nr:TIR domain-containing protein [Leptolyngbyaceae cyanobacterium MO_188.B28]
MSGFQDAFISYGRADSKAFASKIYDRLSTAGLQVWFDFEDIPLAVDYQYQIDDGIEKAHNFLFIISPHAVNSPYCAREIQRACWLNKRVIPLLHVETISYETWRRRHPQGTDADWQAYQDKGLHSSFPNMNPTIAKINWIYFREGVDDFETAFAGLLAIFERQQDYVQQHTSWLVRALAWERHQKQSRYLLTGEDRLQAEAWLKIRFQEEQSPCIPTDIHCEFITESAKYADDLMTHVFLSYAEEDKAVMENVRRSLRREGFTVWTNTTDIQTGVAFQQAIDQGIEEADNLVYLLSPDSLKSEYCQRELDYASSLNKRVIPLLARPTELTQIPDVLRALQYIDLTDNVVEMDYQQDESQLLRILRQEAPYYEAHKILLVKALKWERQKHNPCILLRGYTLRQYETWLKVAKQRTQHQPIPLQESFVSESLRQPPDQTLSVFISSAPNDRDFARKLNETLQIQGKTTWFAQESIASGVDFQAELYHGIENAENFLFIISPASLNHSACLSELTQAQKLNKRIVPVLYRQVLKLERLQALLNVQYVDFTEHEGDFLTNFGKLYRTIESDPDHVRPHTRLLVKAREWQQADQDDSFLLRGKDLAAAEVWLRQAADKTPQVTELQRQYIQESRELPYRRIKVRSVVFTSVIVTIVLLIARLLGVTQPAELRAYDLLMRLRPSESEQDDRFLIVTVDASSGVWLRRRLINGDYEPGIGTVPDKALQEALEKIEIHQPRLIGLDIYRDFEAQAVLKEHLRQTENLMGICKARDEDEAFFAPREIPIERVGFNDFVLDGELFVRRHYLNQAADPVHCNTKDAFSLLLARKYLEAEGVAYQAPLISLDQFQPMQFANIVIPQLWSGSGYSRLDELAGYQTLLNFRTYQGKAEDFAPRVTLEDVLTGQLTRDQVQDRLVIIGYTDVSDRNADLFNTPYGKMHGVILHAQMASQLINLVLEGRPLIRWWSVWGETVWIFGWTMAGGFVFWGFVRPLRLLAAGAGAVCVLFGACYVSLAAVSYWVPLIPATLGWASAGVGVVCLTHQIRRP